MNAETAHERRFPTATKTVAADAVGEPIDRAMAPRLEIVVALEELPYLRLVAYTAEDEERLRLWLASDAAQDRLRYHIENALDWAA
jgi:hypothetical protein